MNTDWLERSRLLVKEQGLERLAKAHVLVVGLGGVGSFAAEFIARAGVGAMSIADGDTVDNTNRNRQLPALISTVGQPKVQVMRDRLLDINPELQLSVIGKFIEPDEMEKLVREGHFDYVADCIDSVTPKQALIAACVSSGVPLVSAMGAGGALDPSQVMVRDIAKSFNCPLAKLLRKRLRNEYGIKNGFKAVFSAELPDPSSMALTDGSNFKKSYYGTISYMPALFGLHAASTIIRDIIEMNKD